MTQEPKQDKIKLREEKRQRKYKREDENRGDQIR